MIDRENMNKNITSEYSDALKEAREHEQKNEKEDRMRAPLQPAYILYQALHKGSSSTEDSVSSGLLHLVWLHSTKVICSLAICPTLKPVSQSLLFIRGQEPGRECSALGKMF